MEIEKHTLLGVLDEFITTFEKKVKKGFRSPETLKHWRTSKDKVKCFIKFKTGNDDILLQDIKYRFAEDYFDYMTLEVERPLQERTANGEIKRIKQILRMCARRDLINKIIKGND